VFPVSLQTGYTQQYLCYTGGDFEIFCCTGATCCTNGSKIWHAPCQISCLMCDTKKTENFTQFRNIDFPQENIPCAMFYKQLTIKICGFALGVPDLLSFTSVVHFLQNFKYRLAAKVYIGSECIYQVQKWYRPAVSLCRFWWG